ncbi:hypothetical protein [Lishizhenia sp.]|uniref:hypothetical protein n=1 Tax=Lishizhenia sp. TaxID=2497594 RepID=UPI00299EF931|nr:hypothetical protein [Lishizhenia sp.]MDX1444636.1 hypothetical protein [Lishizhenia sp.]
MKKYIFILALLLMAATACQKEVIVPNDRPSEVTMTTRGASDDVVTPGAADDEDDNITDPDNDEDETDVESEEDLEALNSKN